MTLESSISQSAGAVRWDIYNWDTESLETVGEPYTIGFDDITHTRVIDDDASRFVSPDQDQFIVIGFKHSVVATFTAQGFDARHDLVEVLVE